MARAVTRGDTTTIYGPGDMIAGAFASSFPINDTAAAKVEATESNALLRAEWLRLLERYEPELQEALDVHDMEVAQRLWKAIERSAYAQVTLATLTQSVIGPIGEQLASLQPQGGRPPVTQLLALACGGRDPTTLRAWRSGKQLVPERAAEFLQRIAQIEVVRASDGETRLRIELALDDS